MVVVLLTWLTGGIYMFLRLDVEAYPDPSATHSSNSSRRIHPGLAKKWSVR